MNSMHTYLAKGLALDGLYLQTGVTPTEELEENPTTKYEHLTLCKKLFALDRRKIQHQDKHEIEDASMFMEISSD